MRTWRHGENPSAAIQSRFSPEVREWVVRLVREPLPHHPSHWAAISAIAPKRGGTKEALRRWLLKAEQDAGARSGPSGGMPLRELDRRTR